MHEMSGRPILGEMWNFSGFRTTELLELFDYELAFGIKMQAPTYTPTNVSNRSPPKLHLPGRGHLSFACR